jgi:hypothetical protein
VGRGRDWSPLLRRGLAVVGRSPLLRRGSAVVSRNPLLRQRVAVVGALAAAARTGAGGRGGEWQDGGGVVIGAVGTGVGGGGASPSAREEDRSENTLLKGRVVGKRSEKRNYFHFINSISTAVK